MRKILTITLGLSLSSIAAASPPTNEESATPASLPRELPGLENVLLVMDGLVNGSAPHGDAGFDSLRGIGIKTILSVDGAAPDTARAEVRGMRYVHLPIAYGGIDEEQGLRIIRAVRDLPKPIYIHCFHGKHRSPSAAAFAAAGLGRMSNDDAVAFMRKAGTSDRYAKLYRAVQTKQAVDPATIDKASADFPACFKLADYVRQMAALGVFWDELDEAQKAGWSAPADHPDLHAPSLADALVDALNAAAANPVITTKPVDFREMMAQSLESARALAAAVTRDDKQESDARLAALRQSCQACHTKYRD